MFFSKKKKPKLDAKVRFQHKQFTGKLQSARTYKRTANAVPESKLQKRLTKVGLGSKWTQIGVGFIILTVLYIVYFPNALTLQNIKISGLSESQARDLELEIRNQIAESNIFTAQRNMLFFRPNLVNAAALKVSSVNTIGRVKKNFKRSTLEVFAESKYEKYLVATHDKVFDVYNDGSVKTESGVKRTEWQGVENPNMLKVQFDLPVNLSSNQQVFETSLRDFMNKLNDQLVSLDNLKIAFYGFKEELEEVVEVEQQDGGVEDSDQSGEERIPQEGVAEDNETAVPKTEAAVSTTADPKQEEKPAELKLPFNSSEVHVFFYKGTDRRRTFRVIFDATRDVSKPVEDFKLLLSQTAPERFEQLYYIDMRIENKAYLCLLNAPCRR
ncbi:hypothetical protein IPM19_03265 [bacterium]|nr:MAG: hypothetical protein IPM19_03265 [bacterium]